MVKNIAHNIVNMIQCRQGEHPLFRSFGMGAIVDSPNRMTRNNIQVEVNRWYPSTIVENVSVDKAGSDGIFEYSVSVRGGENG